MTTSTLDTQTDLIDIILAEVSGALSRVERSQVNELADALSVATRVFVTGEGRSGLMAKAFAMRLMHLGLDVHVIGETTTPSVGARDTLVAVSGSGTTTGTVRVAEQSARVGAAVHAVTTDPKSPMAAAAVTVLTVPAATKYRRGASRPLCNPCQACSTRPPTCCSTWSASRWPSDAVSTTPLPEPRTPVRSERPGPSTIDNGAWTGQGSAYGHRGFARMRPVIVPPMGLTVMPNVGCLRIPCRRRKVPPRVVRTHLSVAERVGVEVGWNAMVQRALGVKPAFRASRCTGSRRREPDRSVSCAARRRVTFAGCRAAR
jgi:6-phospho-3-hexuloisomerase